MSVIPIELLEQFESDNVLLFVGEEINRGLLPFSNELAQELAVRGSYRDQEQMTLPRVAYFFERKRGRVELITFLKEQLWDQRLAPSRVYRLICQLPVPVIVTTTYDDILERAHREEGLPYVAVVSNQDVPYADRRKRKLIWLMGRLDRPKTLVLTESEQTEFLRDNRSLSDVLRAELAQRTWLIIGFDLQQAWFRGFYASVMRQLDRHGRRTYFYGDVPSDYVREWCREHNVEVLSTDVTAFLEELVQVLSERKGVLATKGEEPPPERPYKGLAEFGVSDRRIFFGRRQEEQRLSDLIRAHRLVLLYGASGTGKSSIVQAGLIPLLEYESPPYAVVTARTLNQPVEQIRKSVVQRVAANNLLPKNALLVDFLAQAVQVLHMPLVLVIDQFEEFFVEHSIQSRQRFWDELSAVFKARDLPVKIMLVIREEWLGALSELEPMIPGIYDVRFRLMHLGYEAAREAIERPVEPFGVRFEPALVDCLLRDLGTERIMAPQVQLVCEALYENLKPNERAITVNHYKGLGEAQGILARFLKEELARIPEDQRSLARRVLEELVSSQETKVTRTVSQLTQSLEVSRDELRPILNALAGRLLRVISREGAGSAYELAHEYLVKEIHLSPEALARKQVEELITQGLDNWTRLGTLLGRDALARVYRHRDILRLSLDSQELLLLSAIQHKRDVSYWAKRIDPGQRSSLINRLVIDYGGSDQQARAQAVIVLWALKRYLPWSVRVRLFWAMAQQNAPGMIKRYAWIAGVVLFLGILLSVGVNYLRNLPIPEEMVIVPAGEFTMGSSLEEVEDRIAIMQENTTDKNARRWWTDVFTSEQPMRQVFVDTFYIDKYEVTNAQYQRCIAEKCKAPDSWRETGTYSNGQADYPVVGVSWEDANDYCIWAGRRLPTEVEWEKAARGTDKRIYPWGNGWGDDKANIGKGVQGAPASVNSFAGDVSPYGVYHMAGNVWEWTSSSWIEGSDYKVVRGGYWRTEPHRARCAARAPYRTGGSLPGAGFRCASDTPQKPRDLKEFITSVLR